jgi:diguanylate cyclase (GGDEF)-like protein
MSLVKQLWMAIVLIMTLTFGGSLVVSVLSARHYLEQQLQVKNIDNANVLALALSQLPKDPVTVELLVVAQFDLGHYRFIRIVAPTGEELMVRESTQAIEGAPRWFVNLIPIRVVPGQALIQDGWKQYGTLSLASQEQYAHQNLWNGTQRLLLWFVLAIAVAGAIGMLLVRAITRPLAEVMGQAQAIAERRFLSIAEPRTPELRSVVRAMNSMVERLKAMFSDEATRLETLRQKVNLDPLTGLSGREHFLSQLREVLTSESFGGQGTLVVVRLIDLNDLNTRLGHQRTDAMLKQLGVLLKDSCQDRLGWQAGRLRGGEFAVVCPDVGAPGQAAAGLHQLLSQRWLPTWATDVPDLFQIGAVPCCQGQQVGDLLSQADEALARAATQDANSWYAREAEAGRPALAAAKWRSLLTQAVIENNLRLAFYPVVASHNQIAMHQEGVIRLQLDTAKDLLSAGSFMPMAARLNLTALIDLQVVRLAIQYLDTHSGDLAINLSAETIADAGFKRELVRLLQPNAGLCKRLLLEVTEYGVYRQFAAFGDLLRCVKPLGCRVGIEYFGQRFAEGDKLASLGLDYIKVHPSYMHGIADSPGNQEFLMGLCRMARNFGIAVIALGVESEADLPLLASLGFDGMTGPGVK